MNAVQFSPHPITLRPRQEECLIAAIDTSSMKFGETSTGMLIAIRGAAVWKQKKSYHYTRLGPFIFHITEENKRQVYDNLQRAYFHTSEGASHHSFLNLAQMPLRIAGLLERWLQTMVANTISNGLVLLDGSLTTGTGDSATQLVKEILYAARKRTNVVLAFSKTTNVRANGHLITEVLPEHRPPYLLEMRGLTPRPPTILLGDVYVARFSKERYAFRLDIDREIPFQQKVAATEKLLGNEFVFQSYPESLRLAHILCTFTANEVVAMQHFATSEYGLQIVDRPDMHRILFGPFGKGESYS